MEVTALLADPQIARVGSSSEISEAGKGKE